MKIELIILHTFVFTPLVYWPPRLSNKNKENKDLDTSTTLLAMCNNNKYWIEFHRIDKEWRIRILDKDD